jgi:hypothetical protein
MKNNIKVNDKVMAGKVELVQNIGNGIVYHEGQIVKINKVNCKVEINNNIYNINKNNIYSFEEYNQIKGGVK